MSARQWLLVVVLGVLVGGVLIAFCGCRPAQLLAADASTVVVVVPPYDADLSACEKACMRLGALGCPESKPTPGGETCVTFCSRTEALHVFTLRPDCVLDASTVTEARACGVRCLP